MSVYETTSKNNFDSFKGDFENFQLREKQNIENYRIEGIKSQQNKTNDTTATTLVQLSPVSKVLTPDMSGGTSYTLPSSMEEDLLLSSNTNGSHHEGDKHSNINHSNSHSLVQSPQSADILNSKSISNSQITIKQYLQDIDPLYIPKNGESNEPDIENYHSQLEKPFDSFTINNDSYNINDDNYNMTENTKLLIEDTTLHSNYNDHLNGHKLNEDVFVDSPRRHTEPSKTYSPSIRHASSNINTDFIRKLEHVDMKNGSEEIKPDTGFSSSSNQIELDNVSKLTRRSLDQNSSVRHNTYPFINKSKSQSYIQTLDSSAKEIERMRSSLALKRVPKKKRKDYIEDDRVLVGNQISEGHANFVMAYNMLTGIRVAVSRCSGIMKPLTDQDFEITKKLSFGMDGTELTPSSKYDFKFKDYCPAVFRELRSLFGLDPADYLVSVTGKYILSELGSPGKSGSFFYYSRDYRFIIKTIHHSEHKQLKKILKEYYNHVRNFPNTLISQFYGLHRVKMPFGKNGVRKVHFVVMNNLFPPHRDIHTKYDLKGSTFGRITNIKSYSDKGNNSYTLKDLNWLNNKEQIKFGPTKRKQFLTQLTADVVLLQKLNVMDYSLLLGIHDVKIGNRDDLTSQRLSIFEPVSSDKRSLIQTNPRNINRLNDLPVTEFPDRAKFLFYGDDGGIRATNENDEPLPEIYYLGIIDCLTNYSLKKKLETFWRSLNHSRKTISAIPATEYGDRFLQFIRSGVTKESEKAEQKSKAKKLKNKLLSLQ